MSSQQKVIVIGKIPPPIGGVTIHVKRILEHFDTYNNNQIIFFDLRNINGVSFLNTICKYRIFHLHTSNVYFRFFFSLFCFLTFKKLVITIHGDLGRFTFWKNIFDYLSVRICHIPIVINKGSFLFSRTLNRRSLLMSSFLPPIQTKMLDANILLDVDYLRKGYPYVFCTNAYNISWDKNSEEIYGIIQLLDIFTKLNKEALIISDPSGAYYRYFHKNNISVPKNVMIISYDHDFFEVLKLADVFIRNTTTDGDSLSVKEALYLNKTVFATNIVDRPEGCILYPKQDNLYLMKIINEFTSNVNLNVNVDSCYSQLSDLYTKLLK